MNGKRRCDVSLILIIMSTTTKYFFVDLQGFTEFKKLILKELCILECETTSGFVNMCANDKIHHYIFKPPFEWKQLNSKARTQALWLKCFHHGFSWNSGDTEYSEIESVLYKTLTKETRTPIVYVKGAEKVKWFNHFTGGKFECVNLDKRGCAVNLSDLEHKIYFTNKHCRKHDTSLHCALQNVHILHEWILMH